MTKTDSVEALTAGIRQRDPRAVGKAITLALSDDRNRGDALREVLKPSLGHARRVGITGPPGVGKSTLVAAVTRLLVDRGEAVGIVACDPTSPKSGGAFLGDRVRLAGFRLGGDPNVFFRSLAARGSDESAQEAARQAADVLDAAGYPWVFTETVGVGQSDVAIRDCVKTTVVVLSPDHGDEIQLLKAGILEIADIFVVNRRDQPGAERFRALLEERAHGELSRTKTPPPVVPTEAVRSGGVGELVRELERSFSFGDGDGNEHS